MRHVVEQHRACPALGAVAAELGTRQSQLVAQRPGQRFLLHHFHAARLAVHVERNEPFAAEGPTPARRKNPVAGRAHYSASGDHAENETASRDRFRWVFNWLWGRLGIVCFRHCGFSGFRDCLGSSRWPADLSLILAGIAPSLFEGIARRLPLSYRRGLALAKPPMEVGPDVDEMEIYGLAVTRS